MENNHEKPSVGSGLGIAGLVLGIIALPLAIMPCTFVGGLVLGILGIALSAVGYTQAKKVSASTNLLMAALVVSIISTSFAALRLSNSFAHVKKFPWNKIERKLEKLEENSTDFEKVFEEEFEKELGGKLEDVLKELEEELEEYDEDPDKEGTQIEWELDSLTEKEAARKLGRAAGKALRGFVEELSDSTDIDK